MKHLGVSVRIGFLGLLMALLAIISIPSVSPTDGAGLGIFLAAGSLATARQHHTATLLLDGRVLVAGGEKSSGSANRLASAEIYDPATGFFSDTGSMADARKEHTATRLNSGEILVAGGNGLAGTALVSAELYDPVSDTFSVTGSLATLRGDHTATLLQDGKVLVAGGTDNIISLASAEPYDPVLGTFPPAGNMGTSRWLHTATLLTDGKVLLVGGIGVGTSSSEVYDPVSGTFSDVGPALGGHTCTPRRCWPMAGCC